ncbi:MAG: PadR family transcriptional regulator [Syntrophobacteraceae bacterium]|nr:PadR family transcriptional regulator [Syntrophobacteraceae bacterium]
MALLLDGASRCVTAMDPSFIRHPHQLEGDGLVSSEWNTEAAGPARRMYHLTEEGREMLALWVDCMDRQARSLSAFVEQYRLVSGEGDG